MDPNRSLVEARVDSLNERLPQIGAWTRTTFIPSSTSSEMNERNNSSLRRFSPRRNDFSRHLEKVELLPYHRTAGAKYEMVGRAYDPQFDEAAPPRRDLTPFTKHGISASVL